MWHADGSAHIYGTRAPWIMCLVQQWCESIGMAFTVTKSQPNWIRKRFWSDGLSSVYVWRGVMAPLGCFMEHQIQIFQVAVFSKCAANCRFQQLLLCYREQTLWWSIIWWTGVAKEPAGGNTYLRLKGTHIHMRTNAHAVPPSPFVLSNALQHGTL